MNEATLDLKSLGVGGLVLLLCLREILNFLKPVWEKISGGKSKKSKSGQNALNQLIDVISSSFTGLIGRNIDATKDLHKDVAVIMSKTHDTHEKLGEVQAQYLCIVKEVDTTIYNAMEKIKSECRIMHEKFDNIKCIKQ